MENPPCLRKYPPVGGGIQQAFHSLWKQPEGTLSGAFSFVVVHFIHMTTFSSPVQLLEDQRVALAKEQGFALFPVLATEHQPAFVYSIGMAQHEFPELLCFVAPGMENATIGLMHNLCTTLIESVSRFGRIETLRAFCNKQITARDPEVTYAPRLLTGDTYMYALNAFVTRAARYRAELGMPQVVVLDHEGVPSLEAIRAERMLAA